MTTLRHDGNIFVSMFSKAYLPKGLAAHFSKKLKIAPVSYTSKWSYAMNWQLHHTTQLKIDTGNPLSSYRMDSPLTIKVNFLCFRSITRKLITVFEGVVMIKIPLTRGSIPTPYPNHRTLDDIFTRDDMDRNVCHSVVSGTLTQVGIDRILARGLRCIIPIMFFCHPLLVWRRLGNFHPHNFRYRVWNTRRSVILRLVNSLRHSSTAAAMCPLQNPDKDNVISANGLFSIQSLATVPILHNTNALYSLLVARKSCPVDVWNNPLRQNHETLCILNNSYIFNFLQNVCQ